MASAKLKKKSENRFLSLEQTRTIKPADFKQHQKLRDLSQDDLIELLCLMEAELQAKDVLLKAVLCGKAGVALPLSHLLNDTDNAEVEDVDQVNGGFPDEEDEIWLGEPSAHLNHVSAYHQVVREQMHSIVQTLQSQHKQTVDQLVHERHKHAVDTAQGDDVTYMLEKERERLQMQIDVEQAKYIELEKDRDSLLKLIEKERLEQYNTFNNLLNDCKAFALQLVEQTSKFEKYQKEIDKEKQKNKILSELMVNETQKFKEKLKGYEIEVKDFYVVEQKKSDLEMKLNSSEKQCKETYRLLNEERNKNNKLRYQYNQVRKQLPTDSTDDGEFDGEEDVLLRQDQVEIAIREAKTSLIPVSSIEDRESPDLGLHPETLMQPPTMAVIQKSPTIKQSNKVFLPQSKGIVVSVGKIMPNHLTYNTPKRNSGDERDYAGDYQDVDSQKRNSFESINHTVETSYSAQIRNVTTIGNNPKHDSFEEVQNTGLNSTTPKRNSYEGDSKRIPPPAPPPRRGSALSTDKPPVVKIPHQLQPKKSHGISYTSSRTAGHAATYSLMVLVNCAYGWEYNKDYGLNEVNNVCDFLAFIQVKPTCTWYELTCLVNETFEKNCSIILNEDGGVQCESIEQYQYGTVSWTMEDLPVVSLQKLLAQQSSHLVITLKGVVATSLDDLSYSTMISMHLLEDCIRIISHDQNLLLTVNREVEGEHFASCVANWIKMTEEQANQSCTIIKVGGKNRVNTNLEELTDSLVQKGILLSRNQPSRYLDGKHVLLLDVDYLEEVGFTSVFFDWLLHGVNNMMCNGYHSDDVNLNLHEDVLVIAYATNERVTSLTQIAYRLFKIMSLPSLLPDLVYRWLTQRLVQYSAETAIECNMLGTVKWLSNIHQCLQKSFFKIKLEHQLPDFSVYMEAPLANQGSLHDWIKELWNGHITPCVVESVRQRTGAVGDAQRELLTKATLQALFEKSIRPGAPIEIHL